ncbi:MAG: MBL fold metallo-hydrolase [Alphaproteobacteria bacterium]|nr:MBL fold metallo-hydrolase [Alphaproteobacteria bacterium]
MPRPSAPTWSRRAVLGALASAGCSARLGQFPFDGALAALGGAGDDLEVVFFSVGCFLVRWRDVAVLTDPFFTHVPLAQAGFGKVIPDPRAADPVRPALPDVRAVLVGHAHYDHCLDLPSVVDGLHPDAVLVGSPTAAHTFAPLHLARPWLPIGDALATVDRPGRWLDLAQGRLRVLPILSGHPDNIPGIHLYRRQLDADRVTPPVKASHFQEGLTLAYLVDWLDDAGAITFRVYVETSSTGPPAGLAPPEVFAERPADVALLAMDCATFHARGEPSILDHLDARQVVFCHWGDFFRPKDAEPREGVKVDLPAVRAELRGREGGDRFLFPRWGGSFRFPRV